MIEQGSCFLCGRGIFKSKWQEAICGECYPRCQPTIELTFVMPITATTTEAHSFTVLAVAGQTILEIASTFAYNPRLVFLDGKGGILPASTAIWHRTIRIFHQHLIMGMPPQLDPRTARCKESWTLPGQLADLYLPGLGVQLMRQSTIMPVRSVQPEDDLFRLLGPLFFAIIGRNSTVYSNAWYNSAAWIVPRLATGERLFLTHGQCLLHPNSSVCDGRFQAGVCLCLIQLPRDCDPATHMQSVDTWPSIPPGDMHRANIPPNVKTWRRTFTPPKDRQ